MLPIILLGLLSATPQNRDDLEWVADKEAAPDTKTAGLIPYVLIGPKISLLTLPSPGVGVEVKIWQLVGLSAEYGFVPRINISGVDYQYGSWQGSLKIFPFRGAFFIGGVVGKYRFIASQKNGDLTTSETTVESTYLGPQLGWRWVSRSGFFTGMDFAYGFSLKYASTLTPPNGNGTPAEIKRNADKYLEKGIPLLGFFQLGWLF